EPPELRDRALVVVDAQIDDRVGELRVTGVLLDHEQGRGLLAAPVAAGRLSCGQTLDQPLSELEMAVRLEGGCEGVDGRRRDEDVPLRRVALARAPARPLVTARPGERRGASGGVDDADLAFVPAFVR